MIGKITVQGFTCESCKHSWIPRNKERLPIVCPKCKSPYWNVQRKYKCLGCGKLLNQIPEFKEGECPNDIQHYFRKRKKEEKC